MTVDTLRFFSARLAARSSSAREGAWLFLLRRPLLEQSEVVSRKCPEHFIVVASIVQRLCAQKFRLFSCLGRQTRASATARKRL